jgi:copper(I)-binding protein
VNRALRAATIGVLLFTPVVASACSAGQLNQTSTQERDKTGAFSRIGELTLRGVYLAPPTGASYAAGDDVELHMVVVNAGNTPDQLVSVSGDGFSGFRVSGGGTSSSSASASGVASGSAATTTGSTAATTTGSAPATTTGSAPATTTGSAPATATGSAGGSASGSVGGSATATGSGIGGATGSPSSASAGVGTTSQGVTIPGDSLVELAAPGVPHVFLEGLTNPLTAGQSLRLTFTFSGAGAATVNVLVAAPSNPVPATSTFNFTQAPGPASTSSAGQG